MELSFHRQSFLNNHLSLSRPQFILVTSFKIYSIDIINHYINNIDSTIELHELPSSDIPNRDMYTTITTCDELLFFNYRFWGNGTALWNLWLRHVKWIELEKDEPFNVFGLGYDNSRPEKVYKILGHFVCFGQLQRDIVVYECASHTFKCIIDTPEEDWFLTETAKQSTVSLNGNLYWITRNRKTLECFIRIFDFSRDNFKPFCLLPCQKNHSCDELILAVYEGDRFSLLRPCYTTKKIGIWVTNKKINNNNEDDEDGVVWINLMTLSINNFQNLNDKFDQISYFIYDKTLFMCYGGHGTQVAIYIMREEQCKKIQIDSGMGCHCVYILPV